MTDLTKLSEMSDEERDEWVNLQGTFDVVGKRTWAFAQLRKADRRAGSLEELGSVLTYLEAIGRMLDPINHVKARIATLEAEETP